MSVQVLSPGLLSSLQDAGRPGWRHLGVAVGGAADRAAFELASRLVGARAPFPAALEMTLFGPRLRFEQAACIAFCGAPIDGRCDDQLLPLNRPLAVAAGSELLLGRLQSGCRTYLAVAGGWQVESLLGSHSTDLRGGFGGVQGRALRAGDVLLTGAAERSLPSNAPAWSMTPTWTARPHAICLLRFIAADVPEDWLAALCKREWLVGADSNRQGLRLGGMPISGSDAPQRVSSPVLPGVIQLPPAGLPIVLGVDAQTVGGYPVLGTVIDADLDRLAQLPPGAKLRLQAVSLRTAITLAQQRRAELGRAALAIASKLGAP